MAEWSAIYWPRVKIYSRASLTSGDWEEEARLDCLSVVERASPGVSEAVFSYRAGRVMLPGETAFADAPVRDLVGLYVRVDLLDPVTPEDSAPADTPRRVFVFILRSDRRTIGGDLAAGIAQPVLQTIGGVGLEAELDRITVTGGMIWNRVEDSIDRLRSPLEFNEVGRVGLNVVGNRTAEKKTLGVDNPNTAYAFEAMPREDGTQSDVWSVFDVVEYLNLVFARDIPLDWPYAGTGLPAALALIKPASFAPEGMSVRAAFDALLRPERGISWLVRHKPDEFDLEGPAKLQLWAYPINDAEVPLTDTTLPANADTINLEPADDPDIVSCEVGLEQSEAYGKITVLGERLLSCFTLDINADKLVRDWTDQEEADYIRLTNNIGKAPDDALTEERDVFIGLDDLQHVFCRYRLADIWDGTASGTGAGLVNPVLETDGAIGTTPAGLYRRGVGFEERLPIRSPDRPADDNYRDAGAMYYINGFVLVQTPPLGDETGRQHLMLHNVPGSATFSEFRGDVYMPANRLAVQVHVAEPHVMGNSPGWTEPYDDITETSSVPAVYAWQELKATVALRTNERLFAERTIAEAASERELVIEVPGAELWIVDPATIVGVSGGQPITYGADAPRKVRDDTARVKDVAAAAAAWYGKTHRAMSVVTRRPRYDILLGMFVNGVALGDETAVNLCVSEIGWDFENRVQSIAAGAAAPAFGPAAGGATPTLANPNFTGG